MLRKAYSIVLAVCAVLFSIAAGLHLLDFYMTDSPDAQVGFAFYGVLSLLMREGLRHA